MKKTIDIREKIAVRAYFAWLAGSTAGAEADWLAAEAIERAYAERRAAAAKKAAETRKGRAAVASNSPLFKAAQRAAISAAAKRRPVTRVTAH